MSQLTDTQLTTEANIIKNETSADANTATRVGTMINDVIDSKINNDKISIDGTFASNSDAKVSSEKAVKTYVTSSTPTLQQVLTKGSNLTNGLNFQGTGAGSGNTGTDVIGFGQDAGGSNTGSQVVAFGQGAAEGNDLSNVTVFSNLVLPTYTNHTAAASAITVILGATAGCTYLYHNQATNSIGAVRL